MVKSKCFVPFMTYIKTSTEIIQNYSVFKIVEKH